MIAVTSAKNIVIDKQVITPFAAKWILSSVSRSVAGGGGGAGGSWPTSKITINATTQ